jgi:hypothetical protein
MVVAKRPLELAQARLVPPHFSIAQPVQLALVPILSVSVPIQDQPVLLPLVVLVAQQLAPMVLPSWQVEQEELATLQVIQVAEEEEQVVQP